MKLHVSITEEDLANGVPKDCVRCPSALAIRRAMWCRFPTRMWYGRVDPFGGGISSPRTDAGLPGLYYRWQNPVELSRFIDDLDHRRQVGPITFTLDLKKIT